MKDQGKLIGAAKTAIDNGFSRVGKGLNASSRAERALMLCAARATALGNAVNVLAENDHANEALPLLRELLELAAAMRWLIREDREARGRQALDEAAAARWETLWAAGRAEERLGPEGKALCEAVAGTCRALALANASGLPWGHVFDGEKAEPVAAGELLRLAAGALGHVVKALDERWPGKFPGAEQLWEKANAA